jgi:hypothetical protein
MAFFSCGPVRQGAGFRVCVPRTGEDFIMMSLPAIVGLALGASGFVAFSSRNSGKSFGRKLLYFFGGFIGTIVVLLAVNFAIYAANQ